MGGAGLFNRLTRQAVRETGSPQTACNIAVASSPSNDVNGAGKLQELIDGMVFIDGERIAA